MSNLLDFFNSGGGSAGSGGAVPLRGLIPFPYDSPVKIEQGGMTFLRSGHSELVDFDPSLQDWVNNNPMFVNTYQTWDDSSGAVSMNGSDTDGVGKWMIAGWRQSAYAPLLLSVDNGVTWQPGTFIRTTRSSWN